MPPVALVAVARDSDGFSPIRTMLSLFCRSVISGLPPFAYAADGAPQRIGSVGARHRTGEKAWLALAGAIEVRRVCEQAHQALSAGPGLDSINGRSWTGRRRHA